MELKINYQYTYFVHPLLKKVVILLMERIISFLKMILE